MQPNRTVEMDFCKKIPDERTNGMVMVDKHRAVLRPLHQLVARLLWRPNVLIKSSAESAVDFALD